MRSISEINLAVLVLLVLAVLAVLAVPADLASGSEFVPLYIVYSLSHR